MTKEIPFTDLTYSDRALRIAKRIQQHPENFDMADFVEKVQGCETTYCVAGWAMIEAGYTDEQILFFTGKGVEKIGAKLLGISVDQADVLFYETRATLEETVECLENLANTGEVKWS